MDVTIMLSTTLLAARLQNDFKNIRFEESPEFRWSPAERTIFYDKDSDDIASLLHELAHALLGHSNYQRDLQLIAFERDAWQYAVRKLAPTYQVEIKEEQVEEALDTYRDWIHMRSVCPSCHAVGLQTKYNLYHCFSCSAYWHVNDARTCALRRYVLTP